MEELAPYMRGWRSYFGFCETPVVLQYLTGWVRLTAQGCSVAAVENTAPSPGGAARTGGASEAGKQYCWQRARTLVSRPVQSSVYRAFQCVLQIVRASVIVRGLLA